MQWAIRLSIQTEVGHPCRTYIHELLKESTVLALLYDASEYRTSNDLAQKYSCSSLTQFYGCKYSFQLPHANLHVLRFGIGSRR